MNTTIIIQARMDSTRLPGKVLADLGGKPLLQRVVERARAARLPKLVAVATTERPADDAVEALCAKIGAPCFRGSEEDVLDRYYRAAKLFGADPVIRVTADCPLLDPGVVDLVVEQFLRGGCDYASNTMEYSFPDGLDTEVFSFAALERAWREARLASEREHVTPYIWKNPRLFALRVVRGEEDHAHLRWTVDEPEDLEFARVIYGYLDDPVCGFETVLGVLAKHPGLARINEGINPNEGYEKSLREDHEVPPSGT